MPRVEQSQLWALLAVCLKLGNLEFDDTVAEGGNTGSKIRNRAELQSLSRILVHYTPDCPLFQEAALEEALGTNLRVRLSRWLWWR
jgi:hypothetical protein